MECAITSYPQSRSSPDNTVTVFLKKMHLKLSQRVQSLIVDLFVEYYWYPIDH
jgi:hypothetical protein